MKTLTHERVAPNTYAIRPAKGYVFRPVKEFTRTGVKYHQYRPSRREHDALRTFLETNKAPLTILILGLLFCVLEYIVLNR